MTLGLWNGIGVLLVIALMIGVGAASGKKVKNAADFTTGGGKAGAWLVCGGIMGSLVSGQATIGTAQLAFTYGLSAWWFTLGAGLGCLVLAVGYAAPLRHSGNVTLMQIVGDEYGEKAEYIGSVLSSIGIFISVIAQVLAACALLTTLFPLQVWQAALISAAIMAAYVIFGGAWGAGMGGIVKLLLLYAASILGCVMVLYLSGGFAGLGHSLRQALFGSGLGGLLHLSASSSLMERFGSLTARGAAKDIGSGVSLLLGVLATQTYAQAIWSAKSDSAARKGALLSACLVPPIGVACTLVGLFMRAHYVTAAEVSALHGVPAGMGVLTSTAQVFPVFIERYMPQMVGGIVLGTLLIAVVGGGAGLSLGVATTFVNDIYVKMCNTVQTAAQKLRATRGAILVTLAAAVAVAVVVPGAIINDFGFLSMGLRGAVVFVPMTFALFLRGRANSGWVAASMVAGPAAVLAGSFLHLGFDPLFLGVAISLLLCGAGVWKQSSVPSGEDEA